MQMIPAVHEDLINSTLRSIQENPQLKTDVFIQIKKENPNLWMLIERVVNSDKVSEEFKDGFCRGAFTFYKLIHNQMECHSMESKE